MTGIFSSTLSRKYAPDLFRYVSLMTTQRSVGTSGSKNQRFTTMLLASMSTCVILGKGRPKSSKIFLNDGTM